MLPRPGYVIGHVSASASPAPHGRSQYTQLPYPAHTGMYLAETPPCTAGRESRLRAGPLSMCSMGTAPGERTVAAGTAGPALGGARALCVNGTHAYSLAGLKRIVIAGDPACVVVLQARALLRAPPPPVTDGAPGLRGKPEGSVSNPV